MPSTACVLIDQSLVSYITRTRETKTTSLFSERIHNRLFLFPVVGAFSERIHNFLFLHDLQGRGSGWR